MMELRSKARRLKARESKLGLVVVDYLQLMTSARRMENRVQEVSQISRQLKVLARDLDVPILALSQLSRAVEQRHDKRPILPTYANPARSSRTPTVVFVYRDEYYNAEESESQGIAELILSKYRNYYRYRQAQLPEAVREVRRSGRRVGGARHRARGASSFVGPPFDREHLKGADATTRMGVRGGLSSLVGGPGGVLGRSRDCDRLGRAMGARPRRLARTVYRRFTYVAEHVLERARSPCQRRSRRPARADLRLTARRHPGDAHDRELRDAVPPPPAPRQPRCGEG